MLLTQECCKNKQSILGRQKQITDFPAKKGELPF